ncbi:MAG: leucine--tRNA ligase [Candidatus Aenigmarchaeota archaeon]|nr:leucine--tRNA ligase [Candidatus Aenigmarchaeota archaeon]
MDFARIEKKWQEKWEKEKAFEANIDTSKKKFFITFPYPYVNGAPHIGHAYTSLRTDSYARFKRMCGFNVLYPQGFHATGEPILGVIERLRKGDASQIQTLKQFGATDEDINKFKESPQYLVNFWITEWKKAQKATGFSIDWRRSFVTTTLTPQYSRFIEWQYNTLKKAGYVVQGTHPVIWCPHDESPTGDHDRLEGEGESPVEYTVIKFKIGDAFLVCATLRPETIFGVTNIWINPHADYVKAAVNGEKWIISRHAASKIADQLKKVKITSEINPADLLGKRAMHPLDNKEIPVLPANFVDTNIATGVVMSVPSHAPFDWAGILDLIGSGLERYGVTKTELQPIVLIKTEGLGETPAIDTVNKMGIRSSEERAKLDEATSQIYKKEYHKGILNNNCGKYAGMTVAEAKDKIIGELKAVGVADFMWDCVGVVCRCTTKCHVKILENQWFLKFSDEAWKAKVRKMLKGMKIYPEEARQNFENTIEWLKDKACTRRGGLGTPLPWDKSWIVETLSDSTIYMAYYTIARIINERKIPAETLTDEAFDYIFLGKGRAQSKDLEEMRAEFEYFYAVDLRNSGKDLTQNHLTFYLFHHAAIWPESKWPRAISVNGFVNVEGEKMSKSKGNIIPLKDMLEEFGADMVRLNMITAAQALDDADWRSENVKGMRSRLDMICELSKDASKAKRKTKTSLDMYLENKIKKESSNAIKAYEELRFRDVSTHALFETTNALKWYIRRTGGIEDANPDILSESLRRTVKTLTPMAPHISEEMWSVLGGKGFAAFQPLHEEAYDDSYENAEKLIQKATEDIEEIKKLVGAKKNAKVYIAEAWKFTALSKLAQGIEPAVVIKEIVAMHRDKGREISSFINSAKAGKYQVIPRELQIKALSEAADFMSSQAGMPIIVEEAAGQNPKANAAAPDKPGIFLE